MAGDLSNQTNASARGGQRAHGRFSGYRHPILTRDQLCNWLADLREAGNQAQVEAARLFDPRPSSDCPFTMQFEVDDPAFIYGAERVESPGASRDTMRLFRYDRASRTVTHLLDLP